MTLEPTYMKPVLATSGEPYGETTNMQVPGAVPEPPEAMVIHELVLATAQEALFSLAMLNEPKGNCSGQNVCRKSLGDAHA
jgi:hypothetical protein